MAWHPFKSIRDGLRSFRDGVAHSFSRKQPKQPPQPPTPQRRYQQVRDSLTTEEYPDDVLRQMAIERISDWRFEQFDSSRVERNVSQADMLDVRLMLAVDREGFRQLASVNPSFWYH
jgi:hypothetical protein